MNFLSPQDCIVHAASIPLPPTLWYNSIDCSGFLGFNNPGLKT